jgi:hypothetical protein
LIISLDDYQLSDPNLNAVIRAVRTSVEEGYLPRG